MKTFLVFWPAETFEAMCASSILRGLGVTVSPETAFAALEAKPHQLLVTPAANRGWTGEREHRQDNACHQKQ